MKIPQISPAFSTQGLRAQQLVTLLELGVSAEISGHYLHWDELRRREPPVGISHQEWWWAILVARAQLRTQLPFADNAAQPFYFVRSESVQRDLHLLDRSAGGLFEVPDPYLATAEHRDRYLVHSLMEEAITSSQLEGAGTTRQVAKDMLLSGRRPRGTGEQMIANNFAAMELLRSKLTEPMSVALLLELHEVLTHDTIERADVARLRRADETVVVQDVGNGDVLHVPPSAHELPARLAALCRFANGEPDDIFIHPLIRAIGLHFMLAYDHPFVDGNGRTARALFYWSALRQRYALLQFISISRVIQTAKSQYGRAFLFAETSRGDMTYFLVHQLGVIRQALADLHDYMDRKSRQLRATDQLLRHTEQWNHRQRALLTYALRHPAARYTVEMHQRESRVVYQTARQDLLSLAHAGLLVMHKVGRAFVFHVPEDLEKRLGQP